MDTIHRNPNIYHSAENLHPSRFLKPRFEPLPYQDNRQSRNHISTVSLPAVNMEEQSSFVKMIGSAILDIHNASYELGNVHEAKAV